MIMVGCAGFGNDDKMIDTNTTEVEDTVVADDDTKENPDGIDKEADSIGNTAAYDAEYN